MHSMTGFGIERWVWQGRSYVVEIRSTNHRHLEVRVRLPAWAQALGMEHALQEHIRKHIHRGSIAVSVRVEAVDTSSVGPVLQDEVAVGYAAAWRQLHSQLCPEAPVSTTALVEWVAAQPAVWGKESLQEPSWEVLQPVVERAVGALIHDRAREGVVLQRALLHLLERLAAVVAKLQEALPSVQKKRQALWQTRWEVEWNQTNVSLLQRAWMEEMMAAWRGVDVQEELTRLQAHVSACVERCEQASPLGKHLDFLLQEAQRELNTLGTKEPALVSEVIEGKTLVEQLREQVQNVE